MQVRRVGWKLGIAGAVVSLATIVIIGALTPGHDWINGYISALSQLDSPYRRPYQIGGTIAAILSVAFLRSLWLNSRQTTLLACALGLLGAFYFWHWLAAAFLPCDANCAWLTTTGRLHYATGFTAFVAVSVGVILISVEAYLHQPWRQRPLHIAATIMVASAIVLLIFDLKGIFHGVAERSSAAAVAAWTITLAIITRPA